MRFAALERRVAKLEANLQEIDRVINLLIFPFLT
jgi:hypothetical protein